LNGEVVERAGQSSRGLVDEGDRVVAEQGVRAADRGEVVGE
jgi:hypothetical protein